MQNPGMQTPAAQNPYLQGPETQMPDLQAPAAWGQAPPTPWGRPAAQAAVPGQWYAPSVLRVNAKAALWSGWMMTPGVTINGTPVAAHWGDNDYPVAPGRYRVDLLANYIFPMGRTSLDVDVPPGAVVPVFYAAPAAVYFSGAAGQTPQQTPGRWLTWVSLGLVALVFLLMVLGALVQVLGG